MLPMTSRRPFSHAKGLAMTPPKTSAARKPQRLKASKLGAP